MSNAEKTRVLVGDKEIADKLSTVFRIKCSVKEFEEWDRICKEEFGDSRRVMLSTLLSFYKSLSQDMKDVKEAMRLIPRLLNRIEKIVGGDMNGESGQIISKG